MSPEGEVICQFGKKEAIVISEVNYRSKHPKSGIKE